MRGLGFLREAPKGLGRRKPAPTWERPAARAGATAANPARATATEPGAPREAEAASMASSGATTDAGAMNDAFGSLRGLGFTEAEIRPVLLELRSRDLAPPGLLRESLKILGGGKSSPTWERPLETSRSLAEATPPRRSSSDAVTCRTWERQQPRKYRIHPPETEGAAEREAPYATRFHALRGRAAPRNARHRSSWKRPRRGKALSSDLRHGGPTRGRPAGLSQFRPCEDQDRASPRLRLGGFSSA